jgi:YD repeat-containing protein
MSGIQTWITPGDGSNWQGTRAHTLFAAANVPPGSVIELCSRGNLPFAEWEGGGLRQLPTARPVFVFPKEVRFVYGSWMCARNEMDLSRTNDTMSIGHRFGAEGRRQPGIRPPGQSATFIWQIWVKSLNGYEFAEPAWPFGDLPPISGTGPKPGLGGGSGPGDPRECHVSTCSDSQGQAGDPINTRTGGLDFTLVDLAMPAAAGPLLFQRTYSSSAVDLYVEPLGPGWTHNQDTRLVFEDDPGGGPGLVWFKAHSANRYGFVQYDAGTFAPLPGVLAELTRDPGSPVTYSLTDAAQAVYVFDMAGRLLRWADAEGNDFLYTYDGSGHLERVSAGARLISFAYDDTDRITTVADQTGRTVRFGYDSAGDLVTATDVLGQVWSYAYDGSHRLTQITDPGGVAALRLEYDSEGRAVLQLDGLGTRIIEISYSNDGTSTITDARGNKEVHAYDEHGLLVSTTDALGGATERGYDANLRANSSTDPAGHTTELEWSSDGETLLTVVDSQGNETSLTYDDLNNLLSVTDPRGHTTNYAYDGRLMTGITDAMGQTTTLAYTPQGFPTSITDPRGGTTTFTSNAFGERTSMTDPLGNTWGFDYDDLGRLVEVTDPLGRSQLSEFDAAGRLIRVVQNYEPSRAQNDQSEFNIVTAYDYDPVGNLVGVTDTLGRTTRYVYDAANRLVRTSDPAGSVSQFNYDDAGNLTTLIDPLGHATSFSYDALNRMVSSTDPLGQVSNTTYNPDGTVASTRDPLGRVTSYRYDELMRLISVHDAMGGTTRYSYDAAGNLTSVTDPNGHRTSTAWDALNRPDSVTDPNGNRRTADYDPAGNLLSVSDPLGNTTRYSYDARNLLAAALDPLGHLTSYTYDHIGNPTGFTDANGIATRYEFDRLDRLVTVVQNVLASAPPDEQTNLRTTYGYELQLRPARPPPEQKRSARQRHCLRLRPGRQPGGENRRRGLHRGLHV